jgi:hypothetical protein
MRNIAILTWVLMLLIGTVLIGTLVSCGEVPNYTITCDGPKYGQVAIMINDGCPSEYRKRP